MIKEKYWAIQIGHGRRHSPYLALESVNLKRTPQLFLTREAAEEWATQKLSGRTECYVVKVEIRKIRSA